MTEKRTRRVKANSSSSSVSSDYTDNIPYYSDSYFLSVSDGGEKMAGKDAHNANKSTSKHNNVKNQEELFDSDEFREMTSSVLSLPESLYTGSGPSPTEMNMSSHNQELGNGKNYALNTTVGFGSDEAKKDSNSDKPGGTIRAGFLQIKSNDDDTTSTGALREFKEDDRMVAMGETSRNHLRVTQTTEFSRPGSNQLSTRELVDILIVSDLDVSSDEGTIINVYRFLYGSENQKMNTLTIQMKFLPVWTVLFCVLTILVQIIQLCLYGIESFRSNPYVGPSTSIVAQYGASVASLINMGEYWRVVTALVQHGGIIHAVVNIIITLSLCKIEFENGFWFSFLTFVFPGMFGYLFSQIIVPRVISCGAQPAIASWIGIRFCTSVSRKESYIADIFILFILLVIGVVFPYTDPFSIIAGLVLGILIAMMFAPPFAQDGLSCNVSMTVSVLAYLVCVVLVSLIFVYHLRSVRVNCPICVNSTCINILEWCDYL